MFILIQRTHTYIAEFCGLSSIIEFVAGNIEKQVLPTHGEKKSGDDANDDDDPTPLNNFKPQQKLEMAIELASGKSNYFANR